MKWKKINGRMYISADNKFAIRHVGYKAWSIVENDGSELWEYGNYFGSVYPTVKSAQESIRFIGVLNDK